MGPVPRATQRRRKQMDEEWKNASKVTIEWKDTRSETRILLVVPVILFYLILLFITLLLMAQDFDLLRELDFEYQD